MGIYRNTVKKYWDGEAVPWMRKEYQRPTSVLAESMKDFMQHCLDEDFVIAYRRQNSESFLDAQVRTFDYFGSAPRRVIFDNAKIAVKDGFGAQAKTQDSYAMLAAHYDFDTIFCNPASGNENGLVEGLVGFSRRNFCVPLPVVDSMEQLNDLLQKRCEQYLKHTIRGKNGTVGAGFEVGTDCGIATSLHERRL